MAYAHTLAEDEKRELLRIARATIKEFLISGRIPPGAPHRASLKEPAGVFVSLHQGEELRGCVGQIAESHPIYKAVQEMAIAAASRDPRFPPVAQEELRELSIEISVLGPRRVVTSPEEIVVGRDGLIFTAGARRGLLLPQVATQSGWDAEAFLGKVCEKAGLTPDAWKREGAVVECFPAQVFDEKTLPPMPVVMPGKR